MLSKWSKHDITLAEKQLVGILNKMSEESRKEIRRVVCSSSKEIEELVKLMTRRKTTVTEETDLEEDNDNDTNIE